MGKLLIGILVLALGGVGFYIYNRSTLPAKETENTENTSIGMPVIGEGDVPEMVVTPPETPSDSGAASGTTQAVREFTIDAKNFSFSPNTITVNKGEKVRIIFKNTGGTHDLVIDEFNVATDKIASGASDTVEFVADKTGSFEYYCSVGSHRQMGMKGALIVK